MIILQQQRLSNLQLSLFSIIIIGHGNNYHRSIKNRIWIQLLQLLYIFVLLSSFVNGWVIVPTRTSYSFLAYTRRRYSIGTSSLSFAMINGNNHNNNNDTAVLTTALDRTTTITSWNETTDSKIYFSEEEHHFDIKERSTTATNTPSLGDIMGLLSTDNTVNSTTSSLKDGSKATLSSTYGITHPLDRMVLTANGNVQRLVASYYDAPVQVIVKSCIQRQNNDNNNDTVQIWDRVVQLQVYDKIFCTATSVITVYDPLCQQLVQSKQVGLGQLFRYLDILPEFILHNAAPKHGGGFWRDYTLSCNELSCRIHEDFCPNMWQYKK